MLNLIIIAIVFCSSLGVTISNVNLKQDKVLKAPRKHTQPLVIDREVV